MKKPAKKKTRVVWLAVNEKGGLAYGGEWELRCSDARALAAHHAAYLEQPYIVVRAEVET